MLWILIFLAIVAVVVLNCVISFCILFKIDTIFSRLYMRQLEHEADTITAVDSATKKLVEQHKRDIELLVKSTKALNSLSRTSIDRNFDTIKKKLLEINEQLQT